MGLFGGTKTRAGNQGGPDNVVIKGEGESIVLTYKDPNLQLQLEVSKKLENLQEKSLEAAIAAGELKIATDSKDAAALERAIAAIKIAASLSPQTSWFTTSTWFTESAFDVVLDRAIRTLRHRVKIS